MTLDFSKVSRVYLDAAFLVATRLGSPELKEKAGRLLVTLGDKGTRICASPLGFDEAWHKIIQTLWERDNPGERWNQKDAPEAPQNYHAELATFTNKFLMLPNFELISYPGSQRQLLSDVLTIMNEHSFYARDAFHIAYARANDIPVAITRDGQWIRENLRSPLCIAF